MVLQWFSLGGRSSLVCKDSEEEQRGHRLCEVEAGCCGGCLSRGVLCGVCT